MTQPAQAVAQSNPSGPLLGPDGDLLLEIEEAVQRGVEKYRAARELAPKASGSGSLEAKRNRLVRRWEDLRPQVQDALKRRRVDERQREELDGLLDDVARRADEMETLAYRQRRDVRRLCRLLDRGPSSPAMTKAASAGEN